MGVPVISRAGVTAAGRAGLGILSTVQMSELVAEDDERFIAIAAELAEGYAERSELRRTLRDRMRCSPLMDGRRFAKNMETAYRRMWLEWCGHPWQILPKSGARHIAPPFDARAHPG